MQLRPYQVSAVERFLALKNKRLILAHAGGAGKTITTLEIAKRMGAQSMLVVGSAMARGTWVHEVADHYPELGIHSIRYGRANKSLTKKQKAEREVAYAAPYQVVSYALLKHMDASARDLIVFDEVHALRNPLSQQSRIAKAFMRAHPKAPALLLTATPVPNEVQNIWNPVDTLFPGYLGAETDTGDVSWSFRKQYCLRDENDYGARYYGANLEALPRLAKKLEAILDRVSSAEVAAFAPPLNPSLLWIDDPKLTDVEIMEEWLDAREAEDCTHPAVVAWRHVTAQALTEAARIKGWPVTLINERQHPEQRGMLIEEAGRQPRACLVMQAGSIAESINSLGFVKQGLIFEWLASPGPAVQLMRRFGRQNSESKAPVFLAYVARDDDETDARTLRTRLEAEALLYQQDSQSRQLYDAMSPRPLDEDRLQALYAGMFSETRLSLADADEET